jgi:serine/threonine-protein kinase RsbW
MSTDRVMLTVPARAEYAKTVRMTAAAVVGRMGLTYDELDDIRMAAEEAFVYACDHSQDSEGVTMEFLIAEDSIELKVGVSPEFLVPDEEAERRAAYATFILQSVCDVFELSSDATGPYLRVVKRPARESGDAGA